MVFENGVKSIQAAAYNGARTVSKIWASHYISNIYTTWHLKLSKLKLN